MNGIVPKRKPALSFALVLAFAVAAAQGQLADYQPPELEGVGITEHPDAQVPLDLTFVDENGARVELSRYFDGEHPVILTLNYYRCPMLCTLQLNGLIDGLRELKWDPGKEFEIVTVSIDPAETPTLARAKKQSYLSELGRPSAARGWHFLVGDKKSINTLADTVGYGFRWNPARQEWAHAAAIFICTPDGRVSRYLYGLQYDASTLKYSLIEAGQGRIGSPLEQIILYCFHYDPASGRYAPAAFNIMRIAAGLTAFLVAAFLFAFWLKDARRRRMAIDPASQADDSAGNP